MNTHLSYWRRAFRSHDAHTQRLHREINRAIEGEHDWADPVVVEAVIGKPIAVVDRPDASLGEMVITAVCIVAALFLIGLLAYENARNGGPL